MKQIYKIGFDFNSKIFRDGFIADGFPSIYNKVEETIIVPKYGNSVEIDNTNTNFVHIDVFVFFNKCPTLLIINTKNIILPNNMCIIMDSNKNSIYRIQMLYKP